MGKGKLKYINAFTVLEVTVVIALLGVLMTIITVALNRFNEQVKLDQEIHDDLNKWILVRSNLWTELYNSDSMKLQDMNCIFYQSKRTILYKESDNELMRKENNADWTPMSVEIESIILNESEGVDFNFVIKDEPMVLRCIPKSKNQQIVNTYFERLYE